MTTPSILLFVLGILGATDILLFHMLAHDLRRQARSRAELVTHFLRGPTYCALFLLVPNYRFHGGWFFALAALLAVDVVISIVDFWLERDSRAPLGGLPRGEYVLHVLLAMTFGAMVCSIAYEGGPLRLEPTALVPTSNGPPTWSRIALGVMAPIALGSGIADLVAVLRLPRGAR